MSHKKKDKNFVKLNNGYLFLLLYSIILDLKAEENFLDVWT